MIVTGLLLIMCACGQENRPDSKISSNHQANVDKKTESDGSSRLRKRQIDTMTMMPNRAQKISKIKSVRTIPVSVTNVYEPSRIEASPNEILELVFTRTLAGQDSANPMAMLLATGSALTWLADRYNDTQLRTAGDAIDQAIATTVKEGKTLTADLTNKAHATSLSAVGHAIRHHTAALLT